METKRKPWQTLSSVRRSIRNIIFRLNFALKTLHSEILFQNHTACLGILREDLAGLKFLFLRTQGIHATFIYSFHRYLFNGFYNVKTSTEAESIAINKAHEIPSLKELTFG